MAQAFEWDERKRARNLAKHGVDFVRATLIFDGPTVTRVDTRVPYGEERIQVIGMAGGTFLTVVITLRQGAIRIISARKASRREQATYRAVRPEEAQGQD